MGLKIILAILLWNFALNTSRWIATRRYHVKFQNRETKMLRAYASIDRIFEKAGANEVVKYSSGGPIKIARYIDNPLYRNEVEQCFDIAESVYAFRIKHPISYILQFPIRIMEKIGIPKSAIAKRIIGAVFWAILLLAEYTIGIFMDLELRETLEQFIRNVMKYF